MLRTAPFFWFTYYWYIDDKVNALALFRGTPLTKSPKICIITSKENNNV